MARKTLQTQTHDCYLFLPARLKVERSDNKRREVGEKVATLFNRSREFLNSNNGYDFKISTHKKQTNVCVCSNAYNRRHQSGWPAVMVCALA